MRLLTIAALLIVAIVSACIALVEWSQRITGDPYETAWFDNGIRC